MRLNRVQDHLQLKLVLRAFPGIREPKALRPVVPDHRLVLIRLCDLPNFHCPYYNTRPRQRQPHRPRHTPANAGATTCQTPPELSPTAPTSRFSPAIDRRPLARLAPHDRRPPRLPATSPTPSAPKPASRRKRGGEDADGAPSAVLGGNAILHADIASLGIGVLRGARPSTGDIISINGQAVNCCRKNGCRTAPLERIP